LNNQAYSDLELEKFLNEVVSSKLAVNIYLKLLADGGNTAFGLSSALKTQGLKASKTRVYEELAYLQKLGLIKRISNRPPIYTTIHTPQNLQKIATQFFRDSREDLMKKWAAVYPFLPIEQQKRKEIESTPGEEVSLINFNPYPVVDIFYNSPKGLKNFYYKIFESPEILICHYLVDTCLSGTTFLEIISKDLSTFISHLKNIRDRYGQNLKMRSLSNYYSKALQDIIQIGKLPPNSKEILQFIDYEIRALKEPMMSFALGNKNLFYPIGLGGIVNKTFVVLELKDPEIIDSAKFAFETAWQRSELILKFEEGKVTKGKVSI